MSSGGGPSGFDRDNRPLGPSGGYMPAVGEAGPAPPRSSTDSTYLPVPNPLGANPVISSRPTAASAPVGSRRHRRGDPFHSNSGTTLHSSPLASYAQSVDDEPSEAPSSTTELQLASSHGSIRSLGPAFDVAGGLLVVYGPSGRSSEDSATSGLEIDLRLPFQVFQAPQAGEGGIAAPQQRAEQDGNPFGNYTEEQLKEMILSKLYSVYRNYRGFC